MLSDSHAHLDMPQFDRDREAVIQRAKQAGLYYILTIGSTLENCKKGLRIAQGHDFVYAAVGIHPHDAKELNQAVLDELGQMAQDEKVRAIGEIGLDYYRNLSPPQVQRRAFREQIQLARALNLPVIIHDREAHEEILKILQEEKAPEVGGIIHCFSGDWAFAKKCLDLGFHISIAGPVTYEKATVLQEVTRKIPDERLLIETDCPYLAPAPFRGKRNEPALVVHTARKVAQLRGVEPEDIGRITTLNLRRLLGLYDAETGAVAYRIRNALYINITKDCTNYCVFCVRNYSDFVKGHNLRLLEDPGAAQIIEAVGDPSPYEEIVFCGLGEPFLRLEVIKEVARALKGKAKNKKIRINTNGQGNLIHGRNILPELAGLIDALSVSLNAENAEKYEKLCRPPFGPETYEKIKEFIREAKKYIPEVGVTVLDMPGVDMEACRRVAEEELGVSFRVRGYNAVG